MVIKSTGSWYTVLDGKDIVNCKIKGKFRIQGIKTTNPVTVGDKVEYDLLKDGSGTIFKIEKGYCDWIFVWNILYEIACSQE